MKGEKIMRTQRKTWIWVVGLFAAMALAAGCSNEDNASGGTIPGTGDAGDQTISLEDEYGGFNVADESPAFGDDSLVEEALLEEEVVDGLDGLSQTERDAAEADRSSPNTEIYSFTVLWGNLDEREEGAADLSTDADPVNWSGSLSFDGGSIRVASLIAFDRPEDHLTLPRQGRGELAWVSVTHGGFDGLRVSLLVPSVEGTEIEQPVLRFSALPLEGVVLEYTLEDLQELDVIHEVEATGEQITIHAFKATTAATLAGFMGGRWGFVLMDSTTAEGDPVFVRGFKGRWISGDGELMGFLRGHYGINLDGRPVFFGKYIDQQGNFRGYLHGIWRIESTSGTEGTEDYYEVGTFDGHWSGSQGGALGRLRGHWSRRGLHPGTFSGLWRGVTLIEE